MPHLKLNEFSKTHKIIAVTILCIFTLIGIISVNSGQFDIVYLTLRGNDYKIFGRLLPLILDNFFGTATFFHPNWWKVLLGIIGFIIAGFLILEKVLLNYNAIHEETDNGMLPIAWLIYYFAAAGCFFGLQAFPEMGSTHSFIYLGGVVYLLAACLFSDTNISRVLFSVLITFPLALVLCSVIYLFCFAMIWIAIIFIVIGIFKSLGSLGAAAGGNTHTYNKEADDLNWKRNNVENLTEREAKDLAQRIDEHNRKSGKNLLG